MKIKGTEIADTFAEAFEMVCAKVIITAKTDDLAIAAANSMTGFATSVIGCKCEAAIDEKLSKTKTPDNRPGYSVLIFALDEAGLIKRLVERIGQCVMTCPSTSCFSGFDGDKLLNVGGALRYFGDGHQISKSIDGKRFWRIPVMQGEFLIEEKFGMKYSVGGGNFYILGNSSDSCLNAALKSNKAIDKIPNVIMPFPHGVVRSGSKVGAKKYKKLIASTNENYCPTLKGVVNSELDENINSVLEIVMDAVDEDTLKLAMKTGIKAAANSPGVVKITAGNFDGKLGKYQIHLKDLL